MVSVVNNPIFIKSEEKCPRAIKNPPYEFIIVGEDK